MNRSEVNRKEIKPVVIDIQLDQIVSKDQTEADEARREAERRLKAKQLGDWDNEGGALGEKPQKTKELRPLDLTSDTYLEEIRMGGEGCVNVP